MRPLTRRRLLAGAAAGVTGLSGCGTVGSGSDPADPTDAADGGDGGTGTSGGDGGAGGSDGDESAAESTVSSGATEGPPSGTTRAGGDPDLPFPVAERALPLPMEPAALREEARSGGPPKDGIPSIDKPSFVAPAQADFLQPGDPVFGVARGDTVKAYPQKILVHHEICNDTVDGSSVAVTYCPLTGTAQGFERGDTTFGVSGRLINNNLVMYDRAGEMWWPQIPATSIPGPWYEDPPIASLREFRLVWTSWAQWRDQHPDSEVLSTDTGYARNYGQDPYGSYNPKGGYYDRGSTLFPRLNDDDSYHLKRVFLGARTAEGAVAFDEQALLSAGTMTGELAGTPVIAVADSRFGTGYVYLNPDERSFTADDGRIRGDGETYAPDDLPLERVRAFDAMWFAWIGYYPDSNVYV